MIIQVRFVLVIPQFVIIFICYHFLFYFFVFPGFFLGCIWSGHFLSGSFEVHGNVGFKKRPHSAVSSPGTASSSIWSLVILSVFIQVKISSRGEDMSSHDAMMYDKMCESGTAAS